MCMSNSVYIGCAKILPVWILLFFLHKKTTYNYHTKMCIRCYASFCFNIHETDEVMLL